MGPIAANIRPSTINAPITCSGNANINPTMGMPIKPILECHSPSIKPSNIPMTFKNDINAQDNNTIAIINCINISLL